MVKHKIANAEILIDKADAHILGTRKWFACPKGKSGSVYVYTNDWPRSQIALHRLILGIHGTRLRGDHRNGNGLDNRRGNLRIATHAQNNRNRRGCGKTGFKGVTKFTHCERYFARIKHHGKTVHLGCFGDPAEAARAYDRAAKELFGEFAWLNFQ